MTKGKRGNKVPVLIPEDVKHVLESLVRVRDQFVPVGNKFLLPAANKSGHVDGGVTEERGGRSQARDAAFVYGNPPAQVLRYDFPASCPHRGCF